MKKNNNPKNNRNDNVSTTNAAVVQVEPDRNDASALTPQKDILSPPPVNRKVSFQTRRPCIQSLVCHDHIDNYNEEEEEGEEEKEEGMKSPCKLTTTTAGVVLAATTTSSTADNHHGGDDPEEGGHGNDCKDEEDDDLGSMVSQYGSDIGHLVSTVSLKLADLDVMMEQDEEEHEEKEKRREREEEKVNRKEVARKTIGIGVVPTQQDDDDDDCNDCQQEEEEDQDEKEEEEEEDSGGGYSVDSVDLDSSSSSSLPNRGGGGRLSPVPATETSFLDNAKTVSPPSSPSLTKLNISTSENLVQNQLESSPKTPIGAVSAALRRFGNNVSHMTRCNKLSPSFRYASFVDDDGGGDGSTAVGGAAAGGYSGGGAGAAVVGVEEQHGNPLELLSPKDMQKDIPYSPKQQMWLSPRFDRPSLHPEQQKQQQQHQRGQQQHLRHNIMMDESCHDSIDICNSSSLSVADAAAKFSSTIHQPTLYTSHQSSNVVQHNDNQRHHPQMTEAMDSSFVSSSRNRSRAMMGITSCLSFDPENGKRPYGNMRWSDSPPSSPMPSWKQLPQSTKSWGSTVDETHHMSPKQHVHSSTMPILVLQSPQRVGDIEREDALDLLELLVERSIAFHKNVLVGDTTRPSTNCEASSPLDHNEARNEKSQSEVLKPQSEVLDSERFQECIDALCEISSLYNKSQEQEYQIKQESEFPSHDYRMIVLRRLVDSHTYAMEMKQAALSASTWLTAIGRMGSKRTHQVLPMSQYISEEKLQQMDAKELRSLVHAAHAQLLEKNDVNKKLEGELSLCRGEIGRLKTEISKKENSFLSPNKSILDEDVNDESSEDSDSQNEFPESAEINFDVDEMRNQFTTSKNRDTAATSMIEARKEILLLKAELIEANRLIESMKKSKSINNVHESKSTIQDDTSDEIKDRGVDKGQTVAQKADNDCDTISDVEIRNDLKISVSTEQNTSILLDGLKDELESYISTIRKADKEEICKLQLKLDRIHNATSNSQKMPNSENYMTNWNKLDPLPPPPDHDLRSPIVHNLLSQWTSDTDTHESLLSWIERVVQGQKIIDIAPLQLSGLNQQLRDGFLMHVLPFLLRRADINVEVTAREHRETSYDLSVLVTETGVNHADYIDRSDEVNSIPKSLQMMAFKASATKASPRLSDHVRTPDRSRGHVHNTPYGNRHLEYNDQTEHHHTGIVAGALNAVGGFLSRRRTPTSNNELSSRNAPSLPSTPTLSQANNDFHKEGHMTHSELNESSQPYHRVVSAPPGRIGMTFVQYRGHAMVSDVYKDSPLAGWVFPSDILIAIDEVPVSGMRVPEIVKLLTARKERQRSLRVISSHAMTELLTPDNCDYPND